MKAMRRHVTAALAILMMVCLDASAQRTMRGQMFPLTGVLRFDGVVDPLGLVA